MNIKFDNNKPGKMHHKVFIIDNKTVITGSYNPTKNGNENNDENILIIYSEELAGEYEGKWKIGKCNVDEAPETAQKYGIQSIPTLFLVKDGQVVDKLMGFVSKEALKAKLDG